MNLVVAIIGRNLERHRKSRDILHGICIITIFIRINRLIVMKRGCKIGLYIYLMIRNPGATLDIGDRAAKVNRHSVTIACKKSYKEKKDE
jgi:hypothetical protein